MALAACALVSWVCGAGEAKRPAWEMAWRAKKPMTVVETKAFMKRLAKFVFDNHLKKDPKSQQRGMVYEYFHVARKGQFDQFVQGEGLDTMHDGAWLAAALVNAWRATGDPWYKEFLADWVLPFYLKMLNHSDELFTTKGAVVREGGHPWGKPWAFQEGEKGFIPYWWDDGGSVSLERTLHPNPLPNRPSIDHTVGKPNPKALLNGHSLGMSNHMAQDIGVMLQLAWLMFKDGDAPADKKLAAELAEAARNLHESRVRHFGFIPMCVAPAALANSDPELMQRVPKPEGDRYWTAGRHYLQALRDFEPGKRYSAPGFADDQQYRFYYGLARTGGKLTPALAFKTVIDAYTEPQLFRIYCDDWDVPPGINKFDLHPLYFRDGKPADYRSDRKGIGGRPKPIGSRFGPQNMVCCGWALQILRAFPGIWEGPARKRPSGDLLARMVGVGPLEEEAPDLGSHGVVGDVLLQVSSTPSRLRILGLCKRDEARIRITVGPGRKDLRAVVTVKRGGTTSAVNHKGEKLRHSAHFGFESKIPPPNPATWQRAFSFSVDLPYTVVKGQKPWATGVQHGHYSVQIGKETRNVYLATRERYVKGWLEHELGGGLRTWEAILDEMGYIPTGIGTGQHWDRYSDSGGYAHLISAAAQWILYLEGKSDWEVHKYPEVMKEGK